MNNQKKYFYIILWGTSMYTLQNFISNPDNRIQIILCIAIAYLIYTVNQVIMNDYFYSNRFLRNSIPILIMNSILIPINLIVLKINQQSITPQNIIGYILFNIFVLIIYTLQYRYYKRNINRQLMQKVNNLN